jgi:uncharacterized protein
MLRFSLLLCLTVVACQRPSSSAGNPVGYFEIPVRDLDRATRFYSNVFGYALERQTIDGHPMALFPYTNGAPGASGALAVGDAYVPAKAGPIVYFTTTDIAGTLARANAQGGRTLYPVKSIGANGSVAEFEDSEGNRIALLQPLP